MADLQNGASLSFANWRRILIADLNPAADVQGQYVAATVVLVWPYSSAMGSFSLLLAESDARLRTGKVQLKITFYNSAAKEVAASRIGIGDTIQLGLEGCEWIASADHLSTPGKKADWDLEYWRTAQLEVGGLPFSMPDLTVSRLEEVATFLLL